MGIVERDLTTNRLLRLLAVGALSILISAWGLAQSTGTVSGMVKDAKSGDPISFVNVVLKGTSHGAAADVNGEYAIRSVPPGTYVVIFSAVGYEKREVEGVSVTAGRATTVNAELVSAAIPLSEVLVYGASRRQERITEAPAAVSVINARDIQLNGSHGQLPRLLEVEPGVDIVQSGTQDFNINTRGFNSSLNRRLLVLMDGRDLAIAFLGAQEWNGLSLPLEDIGKLELVRGPGSALYGPNAFNGVISISTPSPEEVLGTKVSFSAGELSMFRGDVRHANTLGERFSYKMNLGRVQSKTWSKSRTNSFEYPGLGSYEVRAMNDNDVTSSYGTARIDYKFEGGEVATVEGGLTRVENELFLTGIGRVQVTKADKPWGRLHYGSERLSVIAWAQGRNSIDPQYSLLSGAPLEEHSSIYHGEAQYNFLTMNDRLRVILGASHRIYDVDTEGTLMTDVHNDNTSGLFGQVEITAIERLKLVGAARYDRSTLHDPEFSPKLAVVWTPVAGHSLRGTFNKAFQVPNYSEFFLRVGAGSADLPFLASPSNPKGTVPVYALGNQDLQVEKITGYELGYKGIFLNDKLFVTVDAYFNQLKNFITDLLQGVNPLYPFNGAPAGLAEYVRPLVPGLTLYNGKPAVVASYSNFGKVDEIGTEVSFNYYLTDELLINGNWTWLDTSVKEKKEGDELLPNAPKHKFGFGAMYRSPHRFELSLTGKNVQPFVWAAGVFKGNIPAYTLLNFAGSYQFTRSLRLGVTISNLLNNEVYQIFGGSKIGRQTIGTLNFSF